MTEGTKLLAQGRPVVLADGSTVRLRYGLHALALLWARYEERERRFAEVAQPGTYATAAELRKAAKACLKDFPELGAEDGSFRPEHTIPCPTRRPA